jgi:hypothetical protein
MKNVISLACLILIATLCKAQDKLYKPDGSFVEAKVMEVNPTEIKYKRFTDQAGAMFVVNKTDFVKIVFENGDVQVIDAIVKNNSSKRNGDSVKYGRNIIGISPYTYRTGVITLFYERINKAGNFGFKITPAIGINAASDINADLFTGGSLGIHFKFYPTYQGNVRGYLGPLIEAGSIKISSTENKYLSLLLGCGVNFQLSKHFSLSIDGAGGIGAVNTGGSKYKLAGDYRIGIGFGIRF